MSKALPVCYAVYYRKMADKARDLGYALTLHGSLLRDADMVAIPWSESAVDPETLLSQLVEVTGGYPQETPTEKPHGRKAWVIQLGAHNYIDLSVMPRVTAPQAKEET